MGELAILERVAGTVGCSTNRDSGHAPQEVILLAPVLQGTGLNSPRAAGCRLGMTVGKAAIQGCRERAPRLRPPICLKGFVMERALQVLYHEAAELADGLAKEIRDTERRGSIDSLLVFAETRTKTLHEVLKAIQKLKL